ncbi:hypothetical protein NQZ79_g8842 [Umbelopsis isabellina]|nr:hypothetical protein NQZ79_g8842 [Umbelopsis isabellina]
MITFSNERLQSGNCRHSVEAPCRIGYAGGGEGQVNRRPRRRGLSQQLINNMDIKANQITNGGIRVPSYIFARNLTPNSTKLGGTKGHVEHSVQARSMNSTWWLKYQPVLPVYSCTFVFVPRERIFKNVREVGSAREQLACAIPDDQTSRTQ